MDKKDWSEHDRRVNKLTGFVPADKEKRTCVTCGKNGHYYYECNNGEFIKMADAFANGLKNIK